MDESAGIDHDIYSRISAAWAKWRKVTVVVSDSRIPPKLIYNGSDIHVNEFSPALSRQTQELYVTKMKMLRWGCGVTRSDRIRNTFTQGNLEVRDVADKVQERRLRWFGHVTRWSKNYVGCKSLVISVLGVKPAGC